MDKTKSWTDRLSSEVHNRLCACTGRREDIRPLVDARWLSMKEEGKDKDGFTREDALIQVLDLLDSNGRYFDLTRAEYSSLLCE